MNFVTETLIPSHPSLQELLLCGNIITDEVAEKIAVALKGNPRIKIFFLNSNRLSVNGVQALAESIRQGCCPGGFGLVANGIGLDCCRMVISSISAKPNFNLFKILWLSGNHIGVEGSKVIANFIPRAKSLLTVGLEGDSLGDEGCRFISSALPRTRSLRELILNGNNISDIGCMAVANALTKNYSLYTLHVENNNITDNGARALQSSLQHVNFSVEILSLSGNEEVTNDQKEQIGRLCNANRQRKVVFRHLKKELPNISLGLWPKAFELFETKPDLLFFFIKKKPDLFRQRSPQRKRKQPEWLRY